MSMRDKISEIITDTISGGRDQRIAAVAILAALPDYDAQEARIKELEAALLTVRNDAIQDAIGCCCPHVDDDQMDAQAKTQCADAIAALKGEKT